MSLQRTDGLTAKDKLNQLAEQKQIEVENTLLKAALAQSSEECEKSLKESSNLLQKAELNRQIENEQRLQELQLLRQQHEKQLNEISQTINSLKTADQKLEHTISSRISDFTDRIQASITAQVQSALNQVYMDLTALSEGLQATQTQCNDLFRHSNEKLTQEYDKILFELKDKQRDFFRFQGFKHFVFWALPVLQIVNTVLLICFLCK